MYLFIYPHLYMLINEYSSFIICFTKIGEPKFSWFLGLNMPSCICNSWKIRGVLNPSWPSPVRLPRERVLLVDTQKARSNISSVFSHTTSLVVYRGCPVYTHVGHVLFIVPVYTRESQEYGWLFGTFWLSLSCSPSQFRILVDACLV